MVLYPWLNILGFIFLAVVDCTTCTSSGTLGCLEARKSEGSYLIQVQSPLHRPLQQGHDGWAAQECNDYVENYANINLTADRKPVMWVHIHKAAGTAVCCAARYREYFGGPYVFNNCNLPKDNYNMKYTEAWTRPTIPCGNRLAQMVETNSTWMSIERPLLQSDICSSFIYATMLRQPMSSIESFINFDLYANKTQFTSILSCIQDGSCHDDVESWLLFDNLIVRMLAGVDAVRAPPGGINSSHLQQARDVLSTFDLVLLFEQSDDAQSRQAMKDVIGWNLPLTRSNVKEHTVHLTPEEKEQMASINTYDVALYEWAEKILIPSRRHQI